MCLRRTSEKESIKVYSHINLIILILHELWGRKRYNKNNKIIKIMEFQLRKILSDLTFIFRKQMELYKILQKILKRIHG